VAGSSAPTAGTTNGTVRTDTNNHFNCMRGTPSTVFIYGWSTSLILWTTPVAGHTERY
jgi:hypothetical protein